MANKKIKSKIVFLVLSSLLFVIFAGLSLKTSGYALPFGWRVEKGTSASPDGYNIQSGYLGVCDRAAVDRGFPFTALMPYDDESDCYDQYNLVAIVLDVLIALIMSIGISWLVLNSKEKIHKK